MNNKSVFEFTAKYSESSLLSVLFRPSMQHSCSRTCQHVDETNVGYWNLYTKIDTHNLQCYNEKRDGSGKEVFRAWEDRLDRSKVTGCVDIDRAIPLCSLVFGKVVESDDDPELLFSIPFSGSVKLTGICVIGENDPSHPNTVKLSVQIGVVSIHVRQDVFLVE